MTPAEDVHLDAGAYALHALPPGEEAVFEAHLATCEACRREVREFREAAARLGAADPMAPPPDLRARVLDEITRVRQLRATRPGPDQDPGPDPDPDPARRVDPDQDPDRRRGPGARASRGRRVLRFVLAASVAVAVALGGIAAWQYSRAEDAGDQVVRARAQIEAARSDAAAFNAVLTAPDARLHTAQLTGGATAAVVVSRAEGRAAFTAQDLPALAAGKVYELWYAAPTGDLRPAGLLPATGRPSARVLAGPLANAVAVGVTVEPSGGSAQPTTEPLGIIDITV
ncbi:anti-sigma factor domain-containing protein [Streptomyces sp. NPDC048338]|uniref:anti-sigma factor n=1 Tax=Streptomyces sp. NPDC048338 TaxID=3365536 RepID=UPI00371BFDB2